MRRFIPAGGGGVPAPIARQTLSSLAGISPHTQHAYEEGAAGISVQPNYGIGHQAGGGGGFQGKEGRSYYAWQLPNFKGKFQAG